MQKKKYILISLILATITVCIAFWGCVGRFAGPYDVEVMTMQIGEQLKPLGNYAGGQYPDSIREYFEHYGLDLGSENIEHVFGTFDSNDQTLAAHIFKPNDYKGTVIVLHGYLNHCGQLRHLAKNLTDRGFAVAAFDMPGHGLSTGDRASIDDFAQYSIALDDFKDFVGARLHGPYHLIGFSNGGAVVIDYLLTGKDDIFNKVVLVAPLVRSVAWEESKIGVGLYSHFADAVPRAIRKNSSDKEFLKFNKEEDYLHAQIVPIKWVNALHKWNDTISQLPRVDRRVKVIQGTKDGTVDYKYNVEFIKEKFSDVDIEMITGGRHELFNESAEIRSLVFAEINVYLEK